MLTISQLPRHLVPFGAAVLEQRARVAAVPAVVCGPEQCVEPKDKIQTGAAAEGVQQVHSELWQRQKSVSRHLELERRRLLDIQDLPVKWTLLYLLCCSSLMRMSCCWVQSSFSLCSSHHGSRILLQDSSKGARTIYKKTEHLQTPPG